jgi:very-short-patch-repair endonuclease
MARQITLLPSEWPELTESSSPRQKGGRTKLAPEELFAEQLSGLPALKVARQYRFAAHIGRNWRFDFAFPEYHLAVEIDGVNVRRIGGELIVQGRHATITGIRGDHEKINTAIQLGWSVLRFLQSDVKPRHAISFTLLVLQTRGWNRTCEQ